MTALPTYRDADFAVETTTDPLRVRLVGNADMDAIEPLEALLGQLHAELVARGARDVEVDLRALEFMNSACLKALVTWVTQILDAPEDQRYRLRFRSNPQLRWQRRSLQALQCFTTELVVLEA